MFHGRQFSLPSTIRDGIINILCCVCTVQALQAGKLEIEPHVHDAWILGCACASLSTSSQWMVAGLCIRSPNTSEKLIGAELPALQTYPRRRVWESKSRAQTVFEISPEKEKMPWMRYSVLPRILEWHVAYVVVARESGRRGRDSWRGSRRRGEYNTAERARPHRRRRPTARDHLA